MNRFFDTHAHVQGKKFTADVEQVLERAFEAGVTDIICIGASDGLMSNHNGLALVEEQRTLADPKRPKLYATVGIHPHEAKIMDDEILARMKTLLRHPNVVGVGETGLDYHYDFSPREEQREVFGTFLELAREAGLPVVVHTREAEEDTIQILKEHNAQELTGVIHCFTGTELLSKAALDLGWYISFSGVLTFNTAESLQAIAKDLPRDRVLVETDCPYLAPLPHRGKRNEPAFVVQTATKLAELWGIDLAETKKITGENAVRLFAVDQCDERAKQLGSSPR